MYYYSVQPKTELYTHIMKYMGSKRELLHEIRKIVLEQDLKGKAVLDLFAGTCGVGMALRDIAPIYSNDIQKYSEIIAKGCLGVTRPSLSKDEILNLIEVRYKENYDAVSALVPNTVGVSNVFKSISKWTENDRISYTNFASIVGESALGAKTDDKELNRLQEEYAKRQNDTSAFPYLQTTHLFSEMYFSVDQAIAIDSIRYAIDNLPNKYSELKNAMLAALIHAYSYASAGTGHFAQFRDLSTISSVKDVFIYRKKSVLDIFLRKAEEIISATAQNSHAPRSKAFAKDYVELLDDQTIRDNVGLIYADPPYSFVHYSRFYHAIEDLCRYDYPEIEHKGRYRKDRHQSPFCIKTQAPRAFEDMFERAHQSSIPLLVSYSNTGMISLEMLKTIATNKGYCVTALEVDHKHSTMGRQKDKNRDVKEALLLCTIN